MSDWLQFLFENAVLSGGFASVLIKILFTISRVYQKVKKVWSLLYTMILVKHTLYNTIICCRFGNFIIHLPNIFTFM